MNKYVQAAIICLIFLLGISKNVNAEELKITLHSNVPGANDEIKLSTSEPYNKQRYKIRALAAFTSIYAQARKSEEWVANTKSWEEQLFIEELGAIKIPGLVSKNIKISFEVIDITSGQRFISEEKLIWSKSETQAFINRLNNNLESFTKLETTVKEEYSFPTTTKDNTQINTKNLEITPMNREHIYTYSVIFISSILIGYVYNKNDKIQLCPILRRLALSLKTGSQ